jgi:membrane protease YdiL (CAAX protease family)
MVRALLYFAIIILAELLTTFYQPVVGIVLHAVLLGAILIDAALIDRYYHSRLVLALSLIPLVRIISLSMPLADIPQIWWYPIIYLPLMVAAIVVMRLLDYKPIDIGVRFGFVPLQLMIGLAGLGLGILEYIILTPEPLIPELTLQTAWLPALILVLSTGLVEEFIFRGVLQKVSVEMFGGWGIVYVSLLFAILHIGFLSWIDIIFVFAIALFFGWIVHKTRSLLGVILCHGIINIVLFIIAPFYF